MADDFTFWRAQLAGKNPETTPGTPHSGYYRSRRWVSDKANTGKRVAIYEPVAIWKEGDKFCCLIGTRDLSKLPDDEIDNDVFAGCCRDAISYETYQAALNGEGWPEAVEERPAEPARIGPDERQTALYQRTPSEQPENERAVIGDNSGETAPFDLIRERVNDVNAQVAEWLKSIGGKVASDEQADKAANFSALLAEIEKEAAEAHRKEKAPILEAQRACDGSWKPVIALAEESKKRIKSNIVTPWLIEKQKRADEAARIEREKIAAEQAAREAEAAAKGEDAPPPPAVTVEPAKVTAGNRGGRGVSLRTVKHTVIEDLPAVAAFFATMDAPPPDFVEVCRKLADKVMKGGVKVPGAKQESRQAAA